MSNNSNSDGFRFSETKGPVLSGRQARQAVRLGRMRYVLVVSLALVAIAFAAIYFDFFGGHWPH